MFCCGRFKAQTKAALPVSPASSAKIKLSFALEQDQSLSAMHHGLGRQQCFYINGVEPIECSIIPEPRPWPFL